MEKIVVTGGAGFIGSHIVDALVQEGYEVHIIDNLFSGKKENVNKKATLHIVDIRDRGKIIPIFKNVKYVFHEAAMPQVQYSIENPIETNDVNVNGLLNVLEAAKINKAKRVIFASSSSVYGEQEVLPTIETISANPLSPYAAHKYIGEIYCKLYSQIYDLETVCLRYFNVYGSRINLEGAYPLVIGYFIKMRKLGKPLPITGDGDQTRDFVHVNDVVKANLLAMKSSRVGRGEFINIGGGRRFSVNRIAELIGGAVEHVLPRIEPLDTQADISKAKDLLKWEPIVPLKNGIAELKKINNI